MDEKKGFIIVSKTKPLPALVRSAFLHNFGKGNGADSQSHLFVGLADGSLVSFSFKRKAIIEVVDGKESKINTRVLEDQKIISLGHAPVSLTPCQVDGKRAVFAAGSRATVLSWEKTRVHNSPIMLKVASLFLKFEASFQLNLFGRILLALLH